MAQHKDYGLIGVGNNLQFGKQGPQVARDGGSTGLNVTDENGITPVTLGGANATQSNHFVTKAQLDSVAADALVADIEYNSSNVTMGTIAPGTKTIQTVFTVDTVFDGNTEIKVGTDSTNDLLLSANYYDLTEAGDYVTVNTLELASNTQIKVFVTQGNSTVGNGTVVVSVLDGPVTGSSGGGNSGIALTDLSVSSASPSGNGSLTYNNISGVFTFTPADTSGGSSQWTTTGSDIYYNTGNVAIGTTTASYPLIVKSSATDLVIARFDGSSKSATGAVEFDILGPQSNGDLNVGVGGASVNDAVNNIDNKAFIAAGNTLDGLNLRADNGYVQITAGGVTSSNEVARFTSSGASITGTLTTSGALTVNTGVSEKFSTLTGATGVVTHDCNNGHIFYHTSISADFTANFTNLGLSTNYSTTLTLILNQGATAYIPSAVQIGGSAQTINWQGGSAPAGTINGIDAASFTVLEVSGSYVVLGQLVDFT